jgi:hypothetical protein
MQHPLTFYNVIHAEVTAKAHFDRTLHRAVRSKVASGFIPTQTINSVGLAKLGFCKWFT